MKIKFFNPNELDRNLKATVHKSGKMGFTIEAANKMGLSIQKGMLIGYNEDDNTDKNLYIVIDKDKQESSFQILKAGAYYYVNTKPLFDTLKVDYVNKTISFDIMEEDIEGLKVFFFKIKEKERAKK
ncbi:MAG: hypothetical protein JST32_03855 [Bacteroidetes bacterium]|nr:hypothetical protein [Bacteroidota bacterium]